MDRIIRPLSETEQSALYDGLDVASKIIDSDQYESR